MSDSSGQRPLGDIERVLFRVFVNCRLSKHPRELYEEYAFTYAQLAHIAGCSVPAMTRWMNTDKSPSSLKAVYLRRLGEFDFLLHHYDQIPIELWNLTCPLPPRIRAVLYPNRE